MSKNKLLKKALTDLASLHDDTSRGAVSEIVNVDEIFEKLAQIGAVDVECLWSLAKRAFAQGREAHWLAGHAGLWAIALGSGPKPYLRATTVFTLYSSDGLPSSRAEWRSSDWNDHIRDAYAGQGGALIEECKAAWDEVNDARVSMDGDNVLLGSPVVMDDCVPKVEMARVMEACVQEHWMNGFVLEKSDAAREAIRGALCALELVKVAPGKVGGEKARAVKPRL